MNWDNPVSRRDFTKLALAGAGAAGVGAMGLPGLLAAAETELKMAFFASPRHPIWANMMAPWGKRIEAANVGLKIKGFPGSQIGGRPPGAYKRVLTGISDIEFHIPGYTSTVFPRTLVAEIPLQYDTAVKATQALNRIFDEHLAADYKRVKVLGIWTTDVPVVMTNKVVRTPDDLKGLKLRTPSRNQAEIIKGLGAIPVAMPMPSTYGALEKGVVDGAIVGISVVNSFKLHEVVKNFIVDLPFGYSPQFIAMNKKKYDSLSAAQRALIDKNSGLDFSLIGAKGYEHERARGVATVNKKAGSSITKLTAAERAQWVGKLETISKEWIARFDKPGLPYRKLYTAYTGKSA
ncbi:MAG: TRAP transporter substrate-binding protein [Alphaproteobacteria bacterium]|nr:TRAP transporter substrate-binding protein [Alphaproteobacteria bacterium]